ncbi:MAG: hypothetical protein GKR89_22430 [Candidatus Latescibacteria bacterium]|nr:hypothetical protein [Candidatus Latescibacterota bacterium]
MPTEMEDYLFDLRGYLVLPQAVDPGHLQQLRQGLEPYLDMEADAWRGHVHRQGSGGHFHNLFEMGDPFERLIDHPAWINHIERYVGGDGLFIDESFADVRGPGAATRLHSGAHKRRIRTQFRFHNGEFRCGQINILLPLTDFGPGDGATMAIPGSHKSNLLHPAFERRTDSLDQVEGAVELQARAGDALCFVDCLAHGSARRDNPGQRRMLIIRYGPHWGNDRYGYQPSAALLQRLNSQRRKIVQPLPPRLAPEPD